MYGKRNKAIYRKTHRSILPFVNLQGTLLLLLIGCSACLQAQIPFTSQPEKTETRKGNKEFDKENYSDAEANYKKALDKKNNMPQAIFNLGDAVYEQKRYDEAAKQYMLSAKTNPDKQVKAKALHNLGNTYLENKKWKEAAEAYASSLRLNPQDRETKYNLAYANAMLHQQQQQGGKNNKQDQKNKDQDKKNQKDQQSKDQQNKDEQEQNKNQQQAKQDQQQQKQQQGQQPKLSKEEAEQLLQALSQEEQKTNEKLQKKQVKAVDAKILKDW